MCSPLDGGFRVFIANYLNGFCSLHVQPAFLPARLEISTLKLERFFKKLTNLSCQFPAESSLVVLTASTGRLHSSAQHTGLCVICRC